MWNLKYTIMPVIIRTTWIVTKSWRKNSGATPRKHSTDSLQMTAHIIRKVLQYENWSLSGGCHRWFKGNTRKKACDKKQVRYWWLLLLYHPNSLIACMFLETGCEAYAAEITKLVEYVDRKKDRLNRCQKAPTQNLSWVKESYTPRNRNTEKNKTNTVQHRSENYRKMATEEDGWTFVT
jgi:hypothetical protein